MKLSTDWASTGEMTIFPKCVQALPSSAPERALSEKSDLGSMALSSVALVTVTGKFGPRDTNREDAV